MVLVTAHVVELKYGIPVAELARWRRLDVGPNYYHPAPRLYRYDMADVDDWFHDPGNAYLHDLPVG